MTASISHCSHMICYKNSRMSTNINYWLKVHYVVQQLHLSRSMIFPTMWDQQRLRPACAYAYQSLCKSLKFSLTVKLLTKHHLMRSSEFKRRLHMRRSRNFCQGVHTRQPENQRGSNIFQRGPNANFYRNPYNL